MSEHFSKLIERPEVIAALSDECSRQFLIKRDGGSLHIFTDILAESTHEDLARIYLNSAKQGVIGGYIRYFNNQVIYSNPSSSVPVASETDMFNAWQIGVELHD